MHERYKARFGNGESREVYTGTIQSTDFLVIRGYYDDEELRKAKYMGYNLMTKKNCMMKDTMESNERIETMSLPLSVIIVAKNEATNIGDCVRSVCGWANEVLVVDDASSDSTREIARRTGANVVECITGTEGKKRNWAYSRAKNDWILSLDADERVTDELKTSIEQLFNHGQTYHGYLVARRNHLGKRWIKYGGEYPSYQLKLFKKELFKYEDVDVHPRAFMEGPRGMLEGDLVHYGYRDVAHWIQKQNRQTTLEAEKWVQTGRKMRLSKALWRAFDRFFRTYIRKRGFKDGTLGLIVSLFAFTYQIFAYAKYWFLLNNNGNMLHDDTQDETFRSSNN